MGIEKTYQEKETLKDIRRLPSSRRFGVAEAKYREAVNLYATTDLTIREVAKKCGVTASGLSAHIGRRHRPLLYARYGLSPTSPESHIIKVKPPRGQSMKTHLKYKDAIQACGDVAYIEFNVSQIARLFNLNGTALASQMRVHYPEIIPNRERIRQRLGIADNTHRGARASSVEAYSDALQIYRDTDLSIPAVAELCGVSKGGFSQFMRFYHKDVISHKAGRRAAASKDNTPKQVGKLSGNGKLYGPQPETVELYSKALELYRSTDLSYDEIAEATGVPVNGLRAYIDQWHPGERIRRRGYDWDGVSVPDVKSTKRYKKSTFLKYEDAIESLKVNPRHVAEVAKEFGLNPETFREYLKNHEPELAESRGMIRKGDGKIVKRTSYERYKDAIEEYATSVEPLKKIAARHGIVYNSIMGFVVRNCPEERESHRRLVEKASSAGERSAAV